MILGQQTLDLNPDSSTYRPYELGQVISPP